MPSKKQYLKALKIVREYHAQVKKEYAKIQEEHDRIKLNHREITSEYQHVRKQRNLPKITRDTNLCDLYGTYMSKRLRDILAYRVSCFNTHSFFPTKVEDLGKVTLSELRSIRGFGKKTEEEFLKICNIAGIKIHE